MELGQDDFLELMVAQLKNQDPMKPMESGEFLGQLAQFGTVNGIRSLQSSSKGLLSTLQSVQALQASNLVGRSVLVKGEAGLWIKEGHLSGMIELPTQATTVQVMVWIPVGRGSGK
jgi:flagellar basal-body rod modification protein FlgD